MSRVRDGRGIAPERRPGSLYPRGKFNRTERIRGCRDFASFSAWASYVGDAELAVDAMRKTFATTAYYLPIAWLPISAPTRRAPEFKAFVTELSLPQYWRRYGWPEHCRPLDADESSASERRLLITPNDRPRLATPRAPKSCDAVEQRPARRPRFV